MLSGIGVSHISICNPNFMPSIAQPFEATVSRKIDQTETALGYVLRPLKGKTLDGKEEIKTLVGIKTEKKGWKPSALSAVCTPGPMGFSVVKNDAKVNLRYIMPWEPATGSGGVQEKMNTLQNKLNTPAPKTIIPSPPPVSVPKNNSLPVF